eukprot:1431921-Rhodomonas_salina.1
MKALLSAQLVVPDHWHLITSLLLPISLQRSYAKVPRSSLLLHSNLPGSILLQSNLPNLRSLHLPSQKKNGGNDLTASSLVQTALEMRPPPNPKKKIAI